MARKHDETVSKSGGVAGCTVNLNSADVDELLSVPGMSKRRAQAIIDYRDEHGPFKSLEDIRNIPGFSESILDVMNQCEITLD